MDNQWHHFSGDQSALKAEYIKIITKLHPSTCLWRCLPYGFSKGSPKKLKISLLLMIRLHQGMNSFLYLLFTFEFIRRRVFVRNRNTTSIQKWYWISASTVRLHRWFSVLNMLDKFLWTTALIGEQSHVKRSLLIYRAYVWKLSLSPKEWKNAGNATF